MLQKIKCPDELLEQSGNLWREYKVSMSKPKRIDVNNLTDYLIAEGFVGKEKAQDLFDALYFEAGMEETRRTQA